MTTSTLDLSEQEFIDLPWKDSIREKLKDLINCSDYKVLCAVLSDDKLKAVGFQELPDSYPEETVGMFHLPDVSLVGLSKTQKAIRLVEQKGYSVHRAAKVVDVNHSAVYKALKRKEGKTVCSKCGQIVREGFTVSQT